MITKTHILEEIKRVANASGGMPPGEKTFQRETGIKKADWFGKIWARWSDALREAAQPSALLFATISGAHLHGLPSPDSNFDLRGAQLLPPETVHIMVQD